MELEFGALHTINLPLDNNLFLENKNLVPSSLEKAVESRKKEFVAGRLCAFEAARKLDINVEELKIGENREPLWPDGIVGSITHTKTIAFAIVDRIDSSKSLGIDVEEIIPDEKFETIERMVATDKELPILKLFGDKNKAYTVLFSAKEALYKLIYPLAPVFFGFQEARLISLDLESGHFTLKLVSEKTELSHLLGIYKGRFYQEGVHIISVLQIPAKF